MASGLRLRSDGQRKANVAKKTVNSDILRNSIGISTGSHGENRLNLQQVYALETMYQTNSVIQAARTVLSGQLLSGGISLRKNGQDVKLKPAFKDHLDEVWLPFAQDVIDSFLKWGFVVVAYEEFEDLYKRQAPSLKKPRLSKADGSSSTYTSMMPIVPALGTYEVSFRMGGKSGYKREYSVIPTNVTASNQADEAARVFVRQAPDQVGNVNSPLASVFEIGSFVSALTELAIVAESSRARPRMVTQMIKKDTNALDPSNLFFDSDSRNAQTATDVEESASQAKALQLQQSVCDLINRLQTRQYGPDQQNNSFSGSKSGKQTYVPPDVAPSLFHLPKVRDSTNSHVRDTLG